ncbi:group I intron-associated PD-(D/E)XK endonuclease [Natrinema sp. SYSU A 869]|uniref:group I intron-associated PD-(D/E)XK endonuclease n=1 Tax=Natrinema sp. SYSU A 869 TaxID=2871694 RepID=UPI00210727E7|nr:group I intron-associated PD-(D/E)XK endonuclease [Natrinema sp. SYSU A 869]
MRNSKAVGDETEARAISKLVACDYSVSIPFGDNDKYGLVVNDGTDLYRLQCKTGWSNKAETIRFNTHSQTTKTASTTRKRLMIRPTRFSSSIPKTDRFIGSIRPTQPNRSWSTVLNPKSIIRRSIVISIEMEVLGDSRRINSNANCLVSLYRCIDERDSR